MTRATGVHVAVLALSIRIDGSTSLKDRRQVVRSLIDRAKARWNMSVADLGPEGATKEARLGFCTAVPTRSQALSRMESLEELVRRMEDESRLRVVYMEQEVDCYAESPY